MKTLPGNSAPEWDDNLIKNISFIKKNLRYPLNRQIFSRSFILAIMLTYLLRLLAMTGVLHWSRHTLWFNIIFSSSLAIIILAATVFVFVQLIKFITVPTPFYLADNQKLLQQFLTAQHLAFYHHPQAPEIFQIISRNINASSKREQREVMVFIADDKRILINSHYTNMRFTITPQSTHYRQMAKRLKEWIDIYYPGGSEVVSANM